MNLCRVSLPSHRHACAAGRSYSPIVSRGLMRACRSRSENSLHGIERKSVITSVLPFELAWSPSAESVATITPQLFAVSLFPYLGFLYHLKKSGKAPAMTFFGFCFLLVFVGATIPAGIYAKVHYGTSLANIDWLHGTAESLLTITNLLIVLGLRQGIREAEQKNADAAAVDSPAVEEARLPR